MMKILVWNDLDVAGQREALARPSHKDDPAQTAVVADIVQEVKARGDAAVRQFSERFDKAKLANFRVPSTEIMAAPGQIASPLREAMERAIANVTAFHEAERPRPVSVETTPGVFCELQWRPIDTVGFYIPGGTAPLFSTLIMQSVPSWVAGNRRRVLCTPPRRDGKVNPVMLAAAQLCGLTEIYAVGGAQAIAAMAYGTESIPKVDKISGPGNMYVTQAKQIVARDPDGAAIDMPAGPSEVMVVTESSPRPDWIAADLLAQAEHDVDAQSILITTDPKLPERVLKEIERQLAILPRKDIAGKSLQQNGRIIIAADMRTAIEISNRYAPEHLLLHNEDGFRWLPDVKHAGSVFLGPWTPESAGDYASGTNHVLPTYGYARAYSGLTVTSYMKSMSVQRITREGIKKLGPVIVTLAEGEGLQAHAAATTERINDK